MRISYYEGQEVEHKGAVIPDITLTVRTYSQGNQTFTTQYAANIDGENRRVWPTKIPKRWTTHNFTTAEVEKQIRHT
jgi:hypothetical protein